MVATEFSIRELDRLCRDFERNWSPNNELIGIVHFAKCHAVVSTDGYFSLLSEVALLDLEKRWISRSDQLERMLEAPMTSSPAVPPIPPSYLDYIRLCNLNEDDAETRRTFAQTELNVRWAFGDIPDIAKYSDFLTMIRRPDVKLSKVKLVIRGQMLTELELTGPIIVGRQIAGEPNCPSVVLGASRKLICADLTETSISRNQLRIEAVAKSIVRLENLSESRNLFLVDNTNLAPGESRLLKLNGTFTVPLADSLIVVEGV